MGMVRAAVAERRAISCRHESFWHTRSPLMQELPTHDLAQDRCQWASARREFVQRCTISCRVGRVPRKSALSASSVTPIALSVLSLESTPKDGQCNGFLPMPFLGRCAAEQTNLRDISYLHDYNSRQGGRCGERLGRHLAMTKRLGRLDTTAAFSRHASLKRQHARTGTPSLNWQAHLRPDHTPTGTDAQSVPSRREARTLMRRRLQPKARTPCLRHRSCGSAQGLPSSRLRRSLASCSGPDGGQQRGLHFVVPRGPGRASGDDRRGRRC